MKSFNIKLLGHIMLFLFVALMEAHGEIRECMCRSEQKGARINKLFIDTDLKYMESIYDDPNKVCISFRDTFNHRKIRSFLLGVSNKEVPSYLLLGEGAFNVTHSDSIVINKNRLHFLDKDKLSSTFRGFFKIDGYDYIRESTIKIPHLVAKAEVYLYPNPNDVRFHIEDRAGEIDSVFFGMRKDRLNRISDATYNKYCYDRAPYCTKIIQKKHLKSSQDYKYPYYDLTREIYLDEILYFNVCVYYKDGRKECTDYKFEYQPNVESVINIW